MTGIELEFRSFLQELINMLETALWLARERPEATVNNLNQIIKYTEKKLKEIT